MKIDERLFKYNLEWLIEKFENGEKLEYIFFWGHQKNKNNDIGKSCFSQWWDSSFIVDGITFYSAEHWMMAQKALLFDDADTFQKIITTKTPKEVKLMGRQIRNFDESKWISKRMEIVVQGNIHKFAQNEELKRFLISTGNKILVESSPVDNIWGIGLAADNEMIENPKHWRGLNLLGFALMEVRDHLKK